MARKTTAVSITLACISMLPAGKAQPARSPNASIDLSLAAPAFTSALKAWSIPPDPQLEFLGDNQLAIAITSELELNSLAAIDQRPRKQIKLLIELFRVTDSGLKKSGEIELPTDSSHSRIAGLPSGRLLVNAGRAVLSYDDEHRLAAQKSAEDVCGLPARWPNEALVDSYLLAASDRLGLLTLSREQLTWFQIHPSIPPRADITSTESYWCWFSAEDLTPQARYISSPPKTSSRNATVNGLRAFGASGQTEVTPQGEKKMSDASCRYGGVFHILRVGDSVSIACKRGEVTISDSSGQLRSIPLGTERQIPEYQTNAWNVPLAVFISTSLSLRLTGGFLDVATPFLVNYQTGRVKQLPRMTSHAPPGLYMGTSRAFAVSPNGKYVAELLGTSLTVIAVDESMRATPKPGQRN
jgi:hypothetical protein